MADFKPYFSDRKFRDHPLGFKIIVPNEDIKVTPLFCPICDEAMRDPADPESFEKWEACSRCAEFFAYPRRDVWLTGWRPSSEELDKYRSEREKIPYIVKW